tara:strand:- start:19 stop:258 length:240 start_codon:yes stop_codon:yes gene_type:complete
MSNEYDPMQSMNGWTENKKLVLHRLEEIEYDLKNIEKRIGRLEKDMAVHASQTRIVAGIIGAITGLVPALLSIFMASRM